MDTRSDKDKEFDKAQAMDRLSQDDKDKISLIKMMMDKEKESMKEVDIENYELEDEDMDNPDEDLVIIGSGYLDIKNKFKGRPNMTNGELATIGQKVVDKLHKGDKDAAIDYIMSKINENIDYKLDPYDDKEEVEGMIIKLIVGKRGVDADIAKSFIDIHYEDIINADGPDGILDEFDEFMSVNTEYVREEDNVEFDVSDASAGDSAIERESASGAFEEAINWRGETLKEQFKRLSK